jgi:hypothetical protein
MTPSDRPHLPPPRGHWPRQPEHISTILGRVLANISHPTTPRSTSEEEAKRRRILARATRRRRDG